MKVAFHDSYIYPLPPKHRFPMEKYELLKLQLLHQGIIDESMLFEPKPLEDHDILLTHVKEYLDKLNAQSLNRKEARNIGLPLSSELVNRGKIIANGTLMGALHSIKTKEVCLNIAGGTHHAYADRGEGFCVFNDFAIAINYLLKKKLIKKALIIDLDVHQGNGNARIFMNNSNVFTFSMHGASNYPLRKEISDLDVPLPNGTDDDTYLKLLHRSLQHIQKHFQADIVFYLSGVDVLSTDKLGKLSITMNGCYERDQIVFNWVKQKSLPIVCAMGGGYSEKISIIVDAHTNTYKAAKEIFC